MGDAESRSVIRAWDSFSNKNPLLLTGLLLPWCGSGGLKCMVSLN